MMRDRAASWDSDWSEPLPRGYRVGSWIVDEPIGAGGWATVYAGRPAGAERDDGTAVALKVMPTAGLAPRQARRVAEAAHREVVLGRTARHPRLVGVLDSLVLHTPDRPSLDGAIVLVMERARCSLRELLGTRIDEAEGARIVTGICEGLAHLHRSGWVHGDLKPENVLIGRDGEVRLSDFGFAVELSGTHGYSAPMGTLGYLPPERWKERLGERGVLVRPTADIWALGIVIHEVFAAGAAPFGGATPATRKAAVQEYAEWRTALRMDPAVPEFWRALATDCLAPCHAARAPHTAERLLERIRGRDAGRVTPRRPRLRIVLPTLAACVVVAGGTALWPYAEGDWPSEGTTRIRVFNAEPECQNRADRDRQCSLGLAIDPLLPYTPENVVPTRVWHGDVLDADCRLTDGLPIVDEANFRSTAWFRVRVPRADPTDTAWLPAVRVMDHPELPRCTHPARQGLYGVVITTPYRP
ncbi:serine/threonine-protein kinase [Streptomyces sp. NPDC059637]|uniref:serine/threonine-protein kinase n=1 Tax=Streptomyces sp. NPDC059637 TaxID=3347752 RepID=UPI003691E4BD